MDILFKQFDNLPHPPEFLVNELVDAWIAKYNTFNKKSDYPELELELDMDLIEKKVQHVSTYDLVTGDMLRWLNHNVFKSDRPISSWSFRMYHRYGVDIGPDKAKVVYEKHLDSVTKDETQEQNNYVLIYNLTDSEGDLVFYKEPDKPLIRTDRPVFIPPSSGINQSPHKKIVFPDAFEVLRQSPPPSTWYLSRLDAIHAVENGNDVPRLALQLRLSEREAKKLLEGAGDLNYRRLNLPSNPLKVQVPLDKFKVYGDQITMPAADALTDEVMDIFKRAGLEPSVCFLFCQLNKQSSPDSRVIHYDLTRADPKPWHPQDDPAKKTWKPIVCGVNWEVTGSITEFGWWDMSKVKQAWPIRKGLPIRFDELNSVHYVKRGNFGVPPGAVKIDSVLIDERPILLRTGIPHQATYNGNDIRLGVSVRFKETWTTWEEAVAAFSKIID